MKPDQLILNTKFTIVMPCYNEEKTLEKSVGRVRDISDENLKLEIIIVDDCSKDNSFNIAKGLATKYSDVKVYKHEKNQGKGAALRTGFQYATGDFVAVQDADLEYDPMELRKLLVPLINGDADVVLGSRFLSGGAHRVLYYWHSLGNKFLTMMSNMFSDLNLTDMETCYKVFKREVIQSIKIEENRFGFEPEIVAKIAQRRLRIFEMGISYYGRTYEEGKKIGAKDGFRALYCIFRYNANKAPVPIQFLFYLLIGGTAALVNLFVFLALFNSNFLVELSAPIAFVIAAIVNYYLSIKLLFRHKAKWNAPIELFMYSLLVIVAGLFDLYLTKFLLNLSFTPGSAKLIATGIGFILNFLGRKYLVFPEKPSGPWKPQQMGA
ncbi:MAG: bifunctional glycosyltransferase family 2/GtrA family protein [Ignavibacteriae bacterium]|nr:bifunctional glycosyltransferase family 2/GtrA family protein [Ignavibacteriota bacterium]